MSWLNGTTILLTGATGFVGKVVLVKLLSEVPHINKIYVLFRKKEGSASLKQRFDKEIISSKAFDALRIRYAKGFQVKNQFIDNSISLKLINYIII